MTANSSNSQTANEENFAQRATGPRLSEARIVPVEKNAWTPAQSQFLAPLEQSGNLYNVFTTIANNSELAKEWWPFASYILRANSLSARDREILILRIGWLCNSEYEWAQHVRLGKAIGLTDDDIHRIRLGPTAEGLSEFDRLLLCAVDELRGDAMMSDTTWKGLSKTYSQKQMMDVVFTVGEYNLVSMALNSFGVQLDEGLLGFRS